MSTTGGLTDLDDRVNTLTVTDIFKIVAIMVVGLIGIFIAIFLFNVFVIDLCVLCDVPAVKRKLHNVLRAFGLHKKEQDEEEQEPSNTVLPSTIELPSTASSGGVQQQQQHQRLQQKEIKERLLPYTSIITSEWMMQQKQHQQIERDNSHNNDSRSISDDLEEQLGAKTNPASAPSTMSSSSCSSCICSICLQDYHIGQTIYTTNTCRHIFHLNCIQQWILLQQLQQVIPLSQPHVQQRNDTTTPIVTNTTSLQLATTVATDNSSSSRSSCCPNCRTPIIL